MRTVRCWWSGRPEVKRNSSPSPLPAAARSSVLRSSPLVFHAFEEALRSPGCPVCRVVATQQERALCSFLYEGMTNSAALETFLSGGGFCREHFRAATSLGVNRWSVGVVEIGILSEHLLSRAGAALGRLASGRRSRGWRRLASQKRPQAAPQFPGRDCVFCVDRGNWESSAIGALEALCDDPELAAGIERTALCLRHGQMALERWKSAARRAWLGDVLKRHLESLRQDLRKFLRKYDYRFSQEPFGREADAVPRAVEFVAGIEQGKQR